MADRNMVSVADQTWSAWHFNGRNYRCIDVNGLPTIQEDIRGSWYSVNVGTDNDYLLAGLAKMTRQISKMEVAMLWMSGEIQSKNPKKSPWKEGDKLVK